jgi:hypothetical protein
VVTGLLGFLAVWILAYVILLASTDGDWLAHAVFTLPFVLGCAVGLGAYQSRVSELGAIGIGSVLFISGTILLFYYGVLWVPLGSAMLGFGLGKFVAVKFAESRAR